MLYSVIVAGTAVKHQGFVVWTVVLRSGSAVSLSVCLCRCDRLLGQKTGLSPDNPFLDPCLPVGLTDMVKRNNQVLHFRGKGDWASCRTMLSPLLARSNTSQASLNGIYQSPIDFNNSEFYGFSEFFYCTEDVLRIGGHYHGPTFAKAAQVTR